MRDNLIPREILVRDDKLVEEILRGVNAVIDNGILDVFSEDGGTEARGEFDDVGIADKVKGILFHVFVVDIIDDINKFVIGSVTKFLEVNEHDPGVIVRILGMVVVVDFPDGSEVGGRDVSCPEVIDRLEDNGIRIEPEDAVEIWEEF